MDNLKDTTKALKTRGEQMENQLKLFSIELCDLPYDVLTLLDKCVEMQSCVHLHQLDLNYLREFYFRKKADNIEHKLCMGKQSAELKKLKNSIEETEKEIDELDKFISQVRKRVISKDALQRSITAFEGKTKALQVRQNSWKIPDDFSIESVIDKLEALEQPSSTK